MLDVELGPSIGTKKYNNALCSVINLVRSCADPKANPLARLFSSHLTEAPGADDEETMAGRAAAKRASLDAIYGAIKSTSPGMDMHIDPSGRVDIGVGMDDTLEANLGEYATTDGDPLVPAVEDPSLEEVDRRLCAWGLYRTAKGQTQKVLHAEYTWPLLEHCSTCETCAALRLNPADLLAAGIERIRAVTAYTRSLAFQMRGPRRCFWADRALMSVDFYTLLYGGTALMYAKDGIDAGLRYAGLAIYYIVRGIHENSVLWGAALRRRATPPPQKTGQDGNQGTGQRGGQVGKQQ